MREENKKVRHEVITKAAYGLLAEKGYDGASMLSIAKAAKASNETLYRWYGDKRGLFEAMVRDNAGDIEKKLKSAIEGRDDPLEALTRIAPIFLTMLLGDRAILLGPVEIHRVRMIVAPMWIMASKLISVLHARIAIRLNSLSF